MFLFEILLNAAPFRAWSGGTGRESGSLEHDALQLGISTIHSRFAVDTLGNTSRIVGASGDVVTETISNDSYPVSLSGSIQPGEWQFQSKQRTANETRPVNIALPVCMYLGLTA